MRNKKKKKTLKTYESKFFSSFWNFSKKVLVSTIVLCILFNSLNIGLVVKAFDEPTRVFHTEEVEKDYSKLKNVGEINELRTEYSKTYIKDNGMYETEYFLEKVHFINGNILEEIDNTLKQVGEYYQNTLNKFSIKLPNVMNKNNKIELSHNDNSIYMYYDSIGYSASLSNQYNRTTKNLKDKIYYNVSDNISLEYEVSQDKVKENKILYSYIENYEYSYYIDTILRIERVGNKLFFYDGTTKVFEMDEYLMYDIDDNVSYDIDFDITSIDNDTYKITVTPSDEYLKDATYPVVIDPTINVLDTYESFENIEVCTVDYYTNQTVVENGNFQLLNRQLQYETDDKVAYLKVFLPKKDYSYLTQKILESQIRYAKLELTPSNINSTSVTCSVHLSKVETEDTFPFTYNTDFTEESVGGVYIHGTNLYEHEFNLLDIITENIEELEYSNVELYFKLCYSGLNYSSITYFNNTIDEENNPSLKIGYIDEAGIKDYYTYEGFNINEDSSAYIAHNSGNLTYMYNDLNDGNLLNLTHIYNDNRKTINKGYGYGFNINYNEVIEQINNYYKLTDGSGNEILFYPDDVQTNKYIACDGSKDVLEVYTNLSENTKYVITKANNSKKEYNIDGRLIKIYPSKNNLSEYIAININDTSGLITDVLDNYGNKIEITNTSSKLYRKNENGALVLAKEIRYTYTNSCLTKFTEVFSDNTTKETNIVYNYYKHIIRVDKNGNGLSFEYNNHNKVTKVKKYSSLYTNGDYVDIVYDEYGERTTIYNSNNEYKAYSFDAYKHTITISDSKGYTTFYKYKDIYYDNNGNVITSPNYTLNHKIIAKSNEFRNITNPLDNHGFEIVSLDGIYGWNIKESTITSIETNSYLYGSKVLKMKTTSSEGYIYQNFEVETGKTYIVSGYIKNENSADAYVNVEGIGGTLSPLSNQTPISNSSNFERFEYKFTSNYTGQAKLKLVTNSHDYVYFDQISISTNYIDTRYNYLENASFDDYSNFIWEGGNDSFVENTAGVFPENFGYMYYSLSEDESLTQTINISGLAGDSFVFGGYCKYSDKHAKLRVRMTLTYVNGDTESNEFVFNQSNTTPTYMMANLIATQNYTQIKLEIMSESEIGYSAIDNFAIYKEGFGTRVSYNEDGYVLEETSETTNGSIRYTYDENNNLTSITKNVGKTNEDTISYAYNTNNELISVTQDNIIINMTYDENGNIVGIGGSVEDSNIKLGKTEVEYLSNGLYISSISDIVGNETTYEYDYVTGLVNKIIYGEDVEQTIIYDKENKVQSVETESELCSNSIVYTYDNEGRITSISNGTTVYYFTYNKYGDLKEIKVNSDVVLTNNYENEVGSNTYTGKLLSSEYCYGTVSFEYDEGRRINKIYKDNTLVIEVLYNDYGEIALYHDYMIDEIYYYNYDYKNNLININTSKGNNITYTYDDTSRLINKTNIIGDSSYTYNSDDKLTSQEINDYEMNYGYSNDSYKLLTNISFYVNNNSLYTKGYTYETISKIEENITNTYYTGRIKKISYTIDDELIEYVYDYDSNSNITKVEEYKNNVLVYQERNTFTDFNQLLEQELLINGVTYSSLYEYNSKGNIIGYNLVDTINNTFIAWGSMSYNNENELINYEMSYGTYTSEYDIVGLPNTYNDYEIEYEYDNIKSIENSKIKVIYTYNANGIRVGKTIINKETNTTTNVSYILEGTKVIKEERTGNENYTVEYHYDINDDIIGFTYNNVNYTYIKDLQGNIMKIVDESGNIMVEYYYDGYGKIVYSTNNDLSKINPYTYRGYYYDIESGWYYLNNRYYDNKTCRFVTMDDIEYLGESGTIHSYNLFTYCEGNPVRYIDLEGHIIKEGTIQNPTSDVNITMDGDQDKIKSIVEKVYDAFHSENNSIINADIKSIGTNSGAEMVSAKIDSYKIIANEIGVSKALVFDSCYYGVEEDLIPDF